MTSKNLVVKLGLGRQEFLRKVPGSKWNSLHRKFVWEKRLNPFTRSKLRILMPWILIRTWKCTLPYCHSHTFTVSKSEYRRFRTTQNTSNGGFWSSELRNISSGWLRQSCTSKAVCHPVTIINSYFLLFSSLCILNNFARRNFGFSSLHCGSCVRIGNNGWRVQTPAVF